jgi:hypothetical protein
VLSVDTLSHPLLRLEQVVTPARIAPVAVYVYAVEDPLPLRLVASRVEQVESRTEAEAVARRAGFHKAGGVAVEGAVAAEPEAVGHANVTREAPGRVELDVESDRPTVVVLRDAHAPGWRARVDGSPVAVLRADGRHMAVPIPAGRSQVTLRYQPPGWHRGLAVFVIGLVATLALATRTRGWV